MPHCSHCSTQLAEGSSFCPSCGKPCHSALPTSAPTLDQLPTRDSPASLGRNAGTSSPFRPLNLSPGAVLSSRFRILGVLGRGGMGFVYKADDLKLGQVVALKFLPDSFSRDADRLARFYSEVRIARQVSHPNVCRVYDVSEIDGHHFLTMEFVDGEDLATLLGRIGRLPNAKALEVAHELCAGIAAAHAKNVIHRDLKPANVMIDGRGHARITDFGIAVAADESSAGELAGTPAYMAPELLDGQPATVQSDLYALGLVLYELYTGKRPWEAASIRDWHKQRTGEPPPTPSSRASDLDPGVERLILQCLQKNPALRPRTALQLAAALPGSNPLSAAIAAGETPSPEMVAAAGEEGSLAPAKAWTLLGAVVGCLLLFVFLAEHSMLANLLPPGKSPDVLSEQARQIAAKIGYSNPPGDSSYWFDLDPAYYRYSSRIPAPQRYRGLAAEFPYPQQFWYRQSPFPLRTNFPSHTDTSFGVTATNPMPFYPGEWTMAMDTAARLTYFAAIGPEQQHRAIPDAPLNWLTLFEAADLNFQQAQAVEPSALPDVPADKTLAWQAIAHGKTLQVQGASFHNSIVFFRVVAPWARPDRLQPAQSSFLSRFGSALFVALVFALLAIGFLFARGNLRQGRGDRQGAIRIAVVIAVFMSIAQILTAHFNGSADWIFFWFILSSGMALTNAAQFALLYVALEPYVRRTWPEILISWSRLLAGGWKDPLVGRDVLIGGLFGVASAVISYSRLALPYWLPVPGTTLGWLGGQSWREPHVFVGNLASNILALMYAIGTLAVVFIVTKLTRSRVAALIIAALFSVATTLLGENILIEVLVASAIAALFLTCLMRFGFLSLCVSQFVAYTLKDGLATFDFSRWYAWRGLAELALVSAIAFYGFKVALGNKPIFGSALHD
jgi:hypothetical protein